MVYLQSQFQLPFLNDKYELLVLADIDGYFLTPGAERTCQLTVDCSRFGVFKHSLKCVMALVIYHLKNVYFFYALTSCYFTCVTHVCVCLCQVGIVLHYSSLSTLLWIGVSARVIYKEALLRTPQQVEGETAVQPTQRPMLRSVKSSWRVGSI